MQLLFLLLLLVGPYALLTLAGRRAGALRLSRPARARVGLSLFFAFTALGHFVRTEGMAAMLPPSVPYRLELIYLTGVFELLGAVCVWVPRLRRLTGVCLIVLLFCVLPANVYAALARVGFGVTRLARPTCSRGCHSNCSSRGGYISPPCALPARALEVRPDAQAKGRGLTPHRLTTACSRPRISVPHIVNFNGFEIVWRRVVPAPGGFRSDM